MNTRLDNTKHTSLNESIAYVNSPQRELDEAREYALALEEVLLALCEELDIDPNALVEEANRAGFGAMQAQADRSKRGYHANKKRRQEYAYNKHREQADRGTARFNKKYGKAWKRP